MTTTDYLIDIGLIAVVLLQVRGRRLSTRALLLPVAVAAWALVTYLHGVPTGGNDLALVAGATAVGAGLGALCAVFTSVWRGADGTPVARAGFLAAASWILGVGTRFAFQLYATHGGGGAITRFSATHGITSAQAWVDALLFMAIAEVVVRTGLLAWRSHALGSTSSNPAPRPSGRA